jgi:thiaminase
MDDNVAALVERALQEIAKAPAPNRFLDLLTAGEVPAERLSALAGELYGLVSSDQRSFSLLAARFPECGLFLAMAGGEAEALRLLSDFAAAVGMTDADLRAYEPRPLTQAYPAYLTRTALFGDRGAIPLALLVNVAESGDTYARVADALRAKYGLGEEAVAHFRYFAETPKELLDQAADIVAAGLADGDDADDAVRTARVVHGLEAAFWQALVED